MQMDKGGKLERARQAGGREVVPLAPLCETCPHSGGIMEFLRTIAGALNTIEQQHREVGDFIAEVRPKMIERAQWEADVKAELDEVRTTQNEKRELLKQVITQQKDNSGAIAALMELAQQEMLPELVEQHTYAQQFITTFKQWRGREREQWALIARLAGVAYSGTEPGAPVVRTAGQGDPLDTGQPYHDSDILT